MLELYQFELSQFCEKVRLILDYKGLDYRKIEVTPGVGQLKLFKLSGQRQVPVLKDGETIIADSTEIAFYLDRKYPEKPIIPTDPVARGQCLLIEEWADESIGIKGRTALIGALNKNPNFRTSILPQEVPDFLKTFIEVVPGDLLTVLGTGIGLGAEAVKSAQISLKQDLEALSLILQHRSYLVTEEPTLADLTVAGLSMILKFPTGDYLNIPNQLKGKEIPELTDNTNYDAFFLWRDRFYTDYRKSQRKTNLGKNNPTQIKID
ncbi:glutathione S-transferase [cyanobacterium endosymbiont of Rhopalodia gibberula]|uniref:glutathione S-transferase n=1 Tax=cyanobacterium endosymbiont of Rhopalodia gibberula TaxID=1763363 RepID=UPI000DC73CE5|nr:glutathione S-transferase family protein [cyanobacterium endosymbiont of Rhopalodia gibberula]BBA79375.1 glutathione S-transferase [cyanobacterium endosymbiont of Rhopalodia gibberula]